MGKFGISIVIYLFLMQYMCQYKLDWILSLSSWLLKREEYILYLETASDIVDRARFTCLICIRQWFYVGFLVKKKFLYKKKKMNENGI